MIPSKKDHPNAWKNGQIRDYRLRAATALGKALPPDVLIHHYKDELVICPHDLYHKYLHVRQRALEATGNVHKRKCVFCKQWDDISNLILRNDWPTQNVYYHADCWRASKRRYYRNSVESQRRLEGEETTS